ncbi:MAG: PA14 domain-containing protein [Candidatus Brocadiia bacterium]
MPSRRVALAALVPLAALLAAALPARAALIGRDYSPVTGHWYELYNRGLAGTRHVADYEDLAQSIDPDVHLVMINDGAENAWLHGSSLGGGEFWIGLFQPHAGEPAWEPGTPGQNGDPLGGWRWYADPANALGLTYTHWHGGEPNDWPGSPPGGENAAHMRGNGRWNDHRTNHNLDGVLEYPDGYVVPHAIAELYPGPQVGIYGKAIGYDPAGPSLSDPDFYKLEYMGTTPGGTLRPGLLGSYYSNSQLPYAWPDHPVDWGAYSPVAQRIDDNINFSSGFADFAGLGNHFSAVWRGKILIPEDGAYLFHGSSDDRSWLAIDGIECPGLSGNPYGWRSGDAPFDNDNGYGRWDIGGEYILDAGYHDIEFRSHEFGGSETARLYWMKPGESSFSIIPDDYFFFDLPYTGWITLAEVFDTQVGDLDNMANFGRLGLPDGTYHVRLSVRANQYLAVAERDVQIVPEPATVALLGGALVGLMKGRRKK